MRNKFIYANGYNISQARKLFKFYFGDFFIKADKNEEKMRFDIFLQEVIKEGTKTMYLKDWCEIDYFNNYWNKTNLDNAKKGPGVFNLIILEEKVLERMRN